MNVKTYCSHEDTEFERGINAWGEATVEASILVDRDSEELQREFTRDEVKESFAKLKNRKATGADGIVGILLKYGGKE